MFADMIRIPPENPLVTQLESRRQRRRMSEARTLFVACEDEIGLATSPLEIEELDEFEALL